MARQRVGQEVIQPRFGSGAGDFVLGKRGDVTHPDAGSDGLAFLLDRPKRVGAHKGDVFHGLGTGRGVPQCLLHAVGDAKDGIQCFLFFVNRCGAKRTRCRQFFIGECDLETSGIVLPDFGVGISHCGPVAKSGDIHSPDIETRIPMHHPVRQCEPDTAALTEAGHHPAGAPVITKSPHRPDQRVSIRGKSERPVDNLFDSSMFKRRKVPEADLERRRNPVKVFL